MLKRLRPYWRVWSWNASNMVEINTGLRWWICLKRLSTGKHRAAQRSACA